MDRPSQTPGGELAVALHVGMEALGLPATPEQESRLLGFVGLLQRWNQRINLTAVRDPKQMLVQHLFDSLAALPPLERRFPARLLRIVDVGSGAGLPGVPWAIMRPAWTVTCVDAVAKKASFVRQVAAELGVTNLRAEHARIEDFGAGVFDVVTCRAFASLVDFTRLTRHLLAEGGCWLAMKGAVPEAEIASLPRDGVLVFHVEPLQVPGLEARRCLIWMRPA